MITINKKARLKDIFKLAGTPGYLIIGYYIIQFLFARQKSDATTIDSSAIVFALYSMLCMFYGLKELNRNNYSKEFRNKMLTATPLKWFISYTFICLISALWSSSLPLSAYRAVECFGIMIIITAALKVLSEKTNVEGIIQWSICFTFILLIFTSVSIFIRYGDIYSITYSCQFPSTIFFFFALYKSPNLIIKIFICGLALMSGSTAAFMGIALGFVSLLFGNRKYKFIGIFLFIFICILSIIIGFDNILNSTIFYERGGFDFENMSGRDKIWTNTLEQTFKEGKEWLGYGFFAGERSFAVKWIGEQVIGMHNGYLSAFVGTGILGLIFFSIFMISITLSTLSNKIPTRYKAVLIASIIVINVHTFGNPGLGFRVYAAWIPSMLIVNIICTFLILKHKK